MLTKNEIKRFIDEDIVSDLKYRAQKGEAYYNGEHDILQYRMFYYNDDGQLVEDRARANSRICHPFFTELVDQFAAYILSFDKNPIQSKAEGLQEHLDAYFDDEFWAEAHELITGANAKGFEYLYAFKNADKRLSFQCADSLGVIEVREKDTDDGCEYIIYWYIDRIAKDRTPIKRIQVHGKECTWFYVQKGDGALLLDEEKPINPLPNYTWKDKDTGKEYGRGLGYIPFWRLDNNKRRESGLHPIKGLIDDADLMSCGLSNNLQDFDKPIHLVKGYQGDDLNELQQNIKTKKILGVDEGGGLEILTVDIPYEARKAKFELDEKNIYRFGMGLDTQGLKDTNATTNIAIKMAYTLLELKAGKMEKRLKRFLKPIIEIVLDEINKENGTGYQYSDVKIDFEHNIQINEKEIVETKKIEAETKQIEVNTILNVAASVGDEKTLEAICTVMDWDFEELQEQLEKLNEPLSTVNAQAALNGVKTDDIQTDGEIIEEAEETAGKPLNGAQTTSLLSIIAQYKAGQLTADEAVSIVAISIGISEQKAKKLLQLKDEKVV